MAQIQSNSENQKLSQFQRQKMAEQEEQRQREELKLTEDAFQSADHFVGDYKYKDAQLDYDDSLPEYYECYYEFNDIPEDAAQEKHTLEKILKYQKEIKASYIIYQDDNGDLKYEFIGYKRKKARHNIMEKLIEKQKKFLETEKIDDLVPLQIVNPNQKRKRFYDEQFAIFTEKTIPKRNLENDYVYLASSGTLYKLNFLLADEYGGGGKEGEGKQGTGLSYNRVYFYINQIINEEDPSSPLSDSKLAEALNEKLGAKWFKSTQITNIRNTKLKPKLSNDSWINHIFPSSVARRSHE